MSSSEVCERDGARVWAREQHTRIMNSIFEELGTRVRDVGEALKFAAKDLRNLGYRRVLLSLVDLEAKRIQGVLDESDDPSVRIDEMTDWPLDDPMADLQPHVIHTRRPKIVEVASEEPLANPEVVLAARMKALAIVPILNVEDEAVGTIHVEREDGAVPSREEVDDLTAFGRQLAIAIDQSERVSLLRSALDASPDPVAIVDRLYRLRYANKPAAELLGIDSGWRKRSQAESLGSDVLGEIDGLIRESLQERRRLVRDIIGIGGNPAYRGSVMTDKILDGQERMIAALLHIKNTDFLHRVFRAFQLVATASDTSSAMSSMLEAAEMLGCKWARLYLVDRDNPNTLVSQRSFGFDNPEVRARFDRGDVILPRRENAWESWLSIDRRTPIVFCCFPDREDEKCVVTPSGLEAINVPKPSCPPSLKKEKGEVWLDFPLVAEDRAFGKLTLQYDEDLPPENFELLKTLSEMAAGLLDGFLRRESEFEARHRWIREAAERTMAVTAHNIANQLAALPVLLERYKMREKEFPGLFNLNGEFSNLMGETLETVKRTKERLSPVVVTVSSIPDIMSLLRSVLETRLPDHALAFHCTAPSLEVQADGHLLKSALYELAQNSLETMGNPENLRVSVTVETLKRGPREWIRILYRDNGPGVPSHLKGQIFDDFYSRRPGRKTGAGLGLGFVRRVVVAHGGSVRERGTPGEGAEFVIEIPRFKARIRSKEESHVSISNR